MFKVSEEIIKEEAARLRSAFNTLKYRKGLTQADVAQACGWKSASTFNRLLYAKTALTESSLAAVCKALEVEQITISPRLVQKVEPNAVLLREIAVQRISADASLRWAGRESTPYAIIHHTTDPGATALVMDGDAVPQELKPWVLLFEKEVKPEVDDWIMFELPGAGETLGKVFNIEASGGVGVIRPDGGKTLLSPARIATLTSLIRKAAQIEATTDSDSDPLGDGVATDVNPRMRGFSTRNPAPGRNGKSAHARI